MQKYMKLDTHGLKKGKMPLFYWGYSSFHQGVEEFMISTGVTI